MAWASTVAVVVPSPATSEVLEATSFTSWAPMFSNLSSSSISLATVTPSLVMRGEPNDFSMTTLRPLGPRVTLTADARVLTPFRMAFLPSWSNLMIFAAMCAYPPFQFFSISRLLFDHAEDVVLTHDEVILAVELDLRAGILAEEHLVADLHVERENLAVFGHLSLADGYHFPLLGFFLGGIGNVDSPRGLGLFLDPLDDDTVLHRSQIHLFPLLSCTQFLRSAEKIISTR